MLPMTENPEEKYKKQKNCHICKEEFYDINATKNSRIVWDYCYETRNSKETPIVCVIKNTKHHKKFLLCSIMALIMTTNL